ncbi:MAG: hypothetical protein K2F75_01355 [Paramuribaculum sp.]|nr:hypothetical protein [Paramuribaculum sp.]
MRPLDNQNITTATHKPCALAFPCRRISDFQKIFGALFDFKFLFVILPLQISSQTATPEISSERQR